MLCPAGAGGVGGLASGGVVKASGKSIRTQKERGLSLHPGLTPGFSSDAGTGILCLFPGGMEKSLTRAVRSRLRVAFPGLRLDLVRGGGFLIDLCCASSIRAFSRGWVDRVGACALWRFLPLIGEWREG